MSSDLSGLAVAKQRFLNFAESLGELRATPIRRDIFEYAAPGFKNERVSEESFDYSFILRNTELRIEKYSFHYLGCARRARSRRIGARKTLRFWSGPSLSTVSCVASPNQIKI